MKYNLNLTRDYVAHWGMQEALRELVANTIDEQGTIKYVEEEEHHDLDTGSSGIEMSRVVFKTPKEIPLEAFLLGYSVKTNQNAIGQFGEGLKLAMLVITRLNVPMKFCAGEYSYQFFFEIPDGFGVETLHIERTEIPDIDQHCEGTYIAVFDVAKPTLDAVYIDAPVDTVLHRKRGLYCQGLLVEPHFYVRLNNKEYGVNINHSIKGNRDRNYFPDKQIIMPILEKSFEPTDFLELSTSWYESHIYRHLSPEFKQRVAKAHFLLSFPIYNEEDLEGVRILMPESLGTRYSKRDGYMISRHWYYGDELMSQKDRQVLKELKIEDAPDVNTRDRKDYELRRYKRLTRMLKDYSKCKDIYELLTTLVNYLPNLDSVTDNIHSHTLAVGQALLEQQPLPTLDLHDLYYADDESED